MRTILWITAFAAFGCAVEDASQPREEAAAAPDCREQERMAIMQSLILEYTDLFRIARDEEICFVSFGAKDPTVRHDPPAECLKLFQTIRKKIAPASECNFQGGDYRDKATGQDGVHISFQFLPGENENQRVLQLGMRRNGYDGMGYSLRIEKKDNTWIVIEHFRRWVS